MAHDPIESGKEIINKSVPFRSKLSKTNALSNEPHDEE